MNLLVRFFILILKRFFNTKKQDIFAPCETGFWVNPFDLDINMHMNNGRYLSIMDLGRFDLMIKAGIFLKLFRAGFYPVVASESIRFKKSLQPFCFFTLVTQIESFDEKDFYMTQKFYVKDELYAEGYIKGRFKQRGRQGSVPTAEIFEHAGKKLETVKLSELALTQKKIESLLVVTK